MIHRHEDGRIAWRATLGYAVGLLVPFWDGSHGRALTRFERRIFRTFPQFKGDAVRGGWYCRWAYQRWVS